MYEQENISELDKSEQEKDLEQKIENILIEKQELGFSIEDLYFEIKKIVNHIEEMEFSKEDLQDFLSKMRNKGKIDTFVNNGETHYIIKKKPKWPGTTVKEESPEVQKTKLNPIISWVNKNRSEITKWVLLLGAISGLLLLLRYNIFQLLIALMVIFIVVSTIPEIIAVSNQSKGKLKYNPPIYGIVALIFNIIGLVLLNFLRQGYSFYGFGGFESLYIVPLSIIAIICSLGGLYGSKDSRPFMAIVGLFFGIILLIVSLWPAIYLAFSFVAIFFV